MAFTVTAVANGLAQQRLLPGVAVGRAVGRQWQRWVRENTAVADHLTDCFLVLILIDNGVVTNQDVGLAQVGIGLGKGLLQAVGF